MPHKHAIDKAMETQSNAVQISMIWGLKLPAAVSALTQRQPMAANRQ